MSGGSATGGAIDEEMMTQWWSAAGGRSLLASAERWGFGGKVNLDKMKEMHEQTPAIIRKCRENREVDLAPSKVAVVAVDVVRRAGSAAVNTGENEPEATQLTALMLVSYHGNAEAAAWCIKAGANVMAADMHGWLALHHAAHEGHPKVVEQLVAEMPLAGLLATTQRTLESPLSLARKWAGDGVDTAAKRYSALAIQAAIDTKSKTSGQKRKAEGAGADEKKSKGE
eukprot:gene21508-701_t